MLVAIASLLLIQRVFSAIALSFHHLAWALSLVSLGLGGWLFLDVANVDAVDSVVEVANVQGKVVVVYQLYVVHLFVDILVALARNAHRHLPAGFRSIRPVWPSVRAH